MPFDADWLWHDGCWDHCYRRRELLAVALHHRISMHVKVEDCRLVVARMLHRRVAKRLVRWVGASGACNDRSFIHSHATYHDRDVLFAAMRSRCQDPADVRRLALT